MIQAIIFDMDGVISDTQKLHSKVESQLLSRFKVNLSPEEITKRYSGVKTKEFFSELLKLENEKIEELMKEKWLEMERLATVSVDEIPGSVKLINKLKDFKLAVASASNKNYVRSVLEKLNVATIFQTVISGDMVSRGKPDPESFLLAAKNLGVNPSECVVIEDGISGMEAAKRAGMYCIGLVSDITKEYPTKNLIQSLEKITPDYIQKLK